MFVIAHPQTYSWARDVRSLSVIILSAYNFIFTCSISAATCVIQINNNDNLKCDHVSGTFNKILSRS